MPQWRGVMPAIVTPFTEGGGLDEAAFRGIYEYNIQAGVHGFWVAGGTGESVMLTDEENMRLATISVEQNAGRVLNIHHVGSITTAGAAKLAQHAAAAGVDAICCVPPFFYKPTNDAIVAHFQAVAAASGGLPLFIYNLPQCTGTEITPELMRTIKEGVPSCVGLKHSGPLSQCMLVRDYVKLGLVCFIGNGRLMLPAMMLGAQGCIDGPPCMAPDVWVRLWNAIEAGDFEKAKELQERCVQITELVVTKYGYEQPAVQKRLLTERLGVPCGLPRLPIQPLHAETEVDILQRAAALGLGKVTLAHVGGPEMAARWGKQGRPSKL